jgi:feruloyl esterase
MTWLLRRDAITTMACTLALGSQLASAAGKAGQDRKPLDADATACSALEGRRFGDSFIAAATFVRPPYYTRWMNTSRTMAVAVPFCRIEAEARPVKGSRIEIEVWLPARPNWNGRFLGVGAGGSMGAVNTNDLGDGVNRGFASVATDNGHRSPGPRDGNEWALGKQERIVDFGYRANHLAAQSGKAIAQAYYGRSPRRAYFFGCSQGGWKGMMEAQRYPADYDGIVAGAPVYNWVDEMTGQAWNVRAVTETPRSALTVEQMQLLQDAAVQRCGGPNGLVADPRQCDFDPSQLQCSRNDGKTCLLPEQVAAVRKIYDGPRTSDGTAIFPGMARGSERGWEQFYATTRADGSIGGGSWYGVYRYMVFDDPDWILPQLDFDRDPTYARRKLGSMLSAESTDLDAFAKRGGKLISYHGWADQQVPPQSSVDYHAAVVTRSTREKVDQYYRLFMVPGMAHCREETVLSSAPAPRGPNLAFQAEYEPGVAFTPENDALTALLQWVEEGRAPSQFVVRVRNEPAGMTPRTVLACAEPAQAVYRGVGDPLDAVNWECRNPVGH